MAVLMTNAVWNDEPIQWFMEATEGPAGRMAKIEVGAARLVSVTRTNDETGEDETVVEPESFYSRRQSVTLFKAGKRVAGFANLDNYDARKMAEAWVEQGE